MERKTLDSRLQELGIYNDYYYKKELKVLGKVLGEYESLNCLLTGVNEGARKMLAVTNSKLIIVFSAVGAGDVKVIKRSAVTDYQFRKKLLFSDLTFKAAGEEYLFSNTQSARKELFEWAMKKPVPEEWNSSTDDLPEDTEETE